MRCDGEPLGYRKEKDRKLSDLFELSVMISPAIFISYKQIKTHQNKNEKKEEIMEN